MRIAIVNDLAIAIEVLRRVIAADPRHSVIWVARDGAEALARAQQDPPDLILMDLLMPVMDGVEATRRIMAEAPCPILVVTGSVGHRAGMVFEAMGHGALDAVNLPVLTEPPPQAGAELLRKIAVLDRYRGGRSARAAVAASPGSRNGLPLIAIGSSTGGPGILLELLGALPPSLPAALVVVQHIDAQFAGGLADWLDQSIPLPVRVAAEGARPAVGQVLVAASNDHLVLRANGSLGYVAEPRELPYRPSVDVFFQSLVRHWSSPGQAVLLTGMGRDGAVGLLALRQAGWHTIAQDEASSVVYGMPRAAAELGAAVEILPAAAIAPSLLRRCGLRSR